MKRNADNHPKTLDLMDRLGKPLYVAVGILECLWHFTAKYAPKGDVGKFNAGAIARAVGWDGDKDALIDALVKSGFLDVHAVHTLCVHDWSTHCDDAVHMQLARAGETFADGTKPRMTRFSKAEKAVIESKYGVGNDPCAQQTHGERTAHAPPPP